MNAVIALAALAAAAGSDLPSHQRAMRADVATLADDAMAGRRIGTAGYELAAEHVIARFRQIGLSPLAGRTWRQPVPLVTLQSDGAGEATLTRGQERQLLDVNDIALSLPERAGDEQVSGAVIAAGHCVVDKAAGLDDFASVHVRGRIVACEAGAPSTLSALARAVDGAPSEQARVAHARGAIGIVVIESRAQADTTSFVRIARAWRAPRTILAEHDDEGRVLALLSAAAGQRLLASVNSPVLTLSVKARREPLRSDNIVGMLPGTDPRLVDRPVIVSAHLDHLGDDLPPNYGSTDRIANGAIDNAIGVASMLSIAERMSARPHARGVVFVAFTAEEEGLLGSSWFVRHLPKAGLRPIADVNIDMPILTYDMVDLLALGAEDGCLAASARAAARTVSLPIVPSPDKEADLARSDQFAFLRAGIAAVLPLPGPGGDGARATAAFLARHYHRPSDDVAQPITWPAADRYAVFVWRLVAGIADQNSACTHASTSSSLRLTR